jgi:signal transduction histidine kinase
VLVASGVATWAVVTLDAGFSARSSSGPFWSWALLSATFVLGFLLHTRSQVGTQLMRAGLAVQIASAELLIWHGRSDLESALLVVTAAQMPFLLSRRAVVGGIALQSLLAAALVSWHEPALHTLGRAGSYVGFQIFAATAAALAIRESRARRALLHMHSELLATQAVLTASTEHAERTRIARDLHDQIGHQLVALNIQLELALHAGSERAAESVRVARELARTLLQDIRDVTAGLQHHRVRALPPALRLLAAGVPQPKVHLDVPDTLEFDEPAPAEALFRCAQEALTNSVRHAQARDVWLEVKCLPESVTLEARDNGLGDDKLAIGSGLSGMKRRLEEVGGGLSLDSQPGQGFVVRAWVPRRVSRP